ncbi:MAG: exonuclease subunit SbcD, partial [Lachnospiraceae bacterium]|nr:exonuclease subunit SbcD [Lachnospiraceae bacterium]
MRFLHLADLHLGKSLYGVSLIDNGDQIFWAERLLKKVSELKPDAVVIAGDVYDRSSPSSDAVMLLNHILTELEQMGIPVMLIAGNHDSGQRLSFAGDILAKQRIYIAGVAETEVLHVTIPEKDGTGEVTFWLIHEGSNL